MLALPMQFLISSTLQLYGTSSDPISLFVYIILSLALLLGVGYLAYQVIHSIVKKTVREEITKQRENEVS